MHDYTLEELLKGLPSDEFAWLADFYGILWDKSSKTRTRAIAGISRQILSLDQLFDEAVMLDSVQWSHFLRICEKPLPLEEEPPAYLLPFLEMGYLFDVQIGDGLFMVMPREVKALLQSDDWRQVKESRDRVSELFLSATAAVNLYGVIEMQQFIDLYNNLFGRGLTVEKAIDLLVDFDMNEISDFVFWRDYIVHATFEEEDFDGVQQLVDFTQGKPRYVPDKHVFLCYARPYYMEQSIAADNMLLFLKGRLKVEEQEAKIMLIELHMLCAASNTGNKMQQALELLGEGDVVFSTRDDVDQFTELFGEMINNTRTWYNKGYTANEMSSIVGTIVQQTQAEADIARPNRNDPCPCGSGKKYRECCGKDDNIITFPGARREG